MGIFFNCTSTMVKEPINYQPIEGRKVTIYQRLKHTHTRKWPSSIFVFWHLPIMITGLTIQCNLNPRYPWDPPLTSNCLSQFMLWMDMIIVLIITIFLGRCHLSWPLSHIGIWELPWWVLSSHQLLIMHITAKLLQDLC